MADEESPLLSDSLINATISVPDGLPKELSKKRLALILGSVYVGVFLAALDSTIIATLSAPISASFNSLSLLSWLASAYLIANSACQPISGRLTDIFSRRTGVVVSNILFAAGNLMCGLADSPGTIIAGRVVAGMGGGGLMTISTFVASDLVPLRKRGIVQGIGNVSHGLGAGLGGLLGGWVNDTWGWRFAFLAQVPLVIASGILVFFTVKIPTKKSDKSRLSRVDFAGAFSLVVTLVLLLLGLNSGGNLVPWTHPLVIISLISSMMSLAVFLKIELKWATEPVIPVRLLLDRTVAAACLTNWLCTMALYMIFFYSPIFLQVQGLSTTSAGLRLIPQAAGISIGSLGAGIIMNRYGKYYKLGLFHVTVFALGIGLLLSLNLDSPTWPPFIMLFLAGFGYGGMVVVTLLAAISAIDHEHQAVITSATYAFRSTGSTIGVTIASAAFQNVLRSQLWKHFSGVEGAADEIRRIRDNFDELKQLPFGWNEGVLDSYATAFHVVFALALGIVVLGLVCAAFIRQHVLHVTLDRK